MLRLPYSSTRSGASSGCFPVLAGRDEKCPREDPPPASTSLLQVLPLGLVPPPPFLCPPYTGDGCLIQLQNRPPRRNRYMELFHRLRFGGNCAALFPVGEIGASSLVQRTSASPCFPPVSIDVILQLVLAPRAKGSRKWLDRRPISCQTTGGRAVVDLVKTVT